MAANSWGWLIMAMCPASKSRVSTVSEVGDHHVLGIEGDAGITGQSDVRPRYGMPQAGEIRGLEENLEGLGNSARQGRRCLALVHVVAEHRDEQVRMKAAFTIDDIVPDPRRNFMDRRAEVAENVGQRACRGAGPNRRRRRGGRVDRECARRRPAG